MYSNIRLQSNTEQRDNEILVLLQEGQMYGHFRLAAIVKPNDR